MALIACLATGYVYRPLLHAMVDPGVSDAWGIEVDSLKCKKADAFLVRSQEEARSGEICLFHGKPSITCSAVEEVKHCKFLPIPK